MTTHTNNPAAPSPWVVNYLSQIVAPGPVLDLACGQGRHTRLLRQFGYQVVATDINLQGMDDIKETQGITLVEADLETTHWPFEPDFFTGVIVTNYLHRPLFPKLLNALQENGLLIYETFACGNEQYGRPRNPEFLLRKNELLDVFGSDLDVIAFEQGEELSPSPAVRQRICARKPVPERTGK